MSVLEDLTALEGRIIERLRELEPALREHEQLLQVANRLGLDVPVRDESAASDSSAAANGNGDGRASADSNASGGRRRSRTSATRSRTAEVSAKSATRGRTKTRKSGGSSRSGRRRRQGSGSRREQVLALVQQHPDGITVAQLGTELGVDATSLYRVVRQLQEDGAIAKNGKALTPLGS